jgi:hypothetical protein
MGKWEFGMGKAEGGLRPVGAYAPEGSGTRRRPIERDFRLRIKIQSYAVTRPASRIKTQSYAETRCRG